MSEIRETSTIRQVEAPPPEPMITLADLLAGAGWLAVKGGILAYRGIRALSESIQENRQAHLSTVDLAKIIAESEDARQAIAALSQCSNVELPKAQSRLLKSRVEKLVATNDKTGALTLARELLTARQDRLQTTLLKFAAESCREIGFAKIITFCDTVIAKSADGRRTFTVDVEKTRDGGVQINRDSDGFHGGSCAPIHDAFDHVMRVKGVRYDSWKRRRKHDRPVVHRGRVPERILARRAN